MDSKLKRLTISCMVFLTLLVLLFVVYLNRSRLERREDSQDEQNSQQVAQEQKETFEGTRIGNDLSAFLNDEAFFDKEKSKYEQYLEQKNTLSMILTSIEKDLRIKAGA